MTCEEILDVIPAFANKEVNGEERIRIKNHLISCQNCREKYFLQLKLNYSIDRESVFDTSPELAGNFKSEILDIIAEQKKERIKRLNPWVWYAAAAILIIVFMVGRFTVQFSENQKTHTTSIDVPLSQLLVSENWAKLESVLSDQHEFNKYASDQISIEILLEKLIILHNMGIEKLSIVSNSPTSPGIDTSLKDEGPDLVISIHDFIQILQQAKQQRSQITLADVSVILSTI